MRNEEFAARDVLSRHIYWGAVVGGAVMTFAVEVVLALLGLGLGLVSLQPQSSLASGAMATGAITWWFISGLVALFLGSWVTGRLASLPSQWDGLLHGLLTWGLVCVASLLLMGTTVGALIGSGYSALQLDRSAQQRFMQGIDNAEERVQSGVDENGQPLLTPAEAARVEKAAKAAGDASLIACLALMLGAVVSTLGGAQGVRSPMGSNGRERSMGQGLPAQAR